MQLIVGLGNPGEEYKKTRHNIGFAVLDSLGQKFTVDNTWKFNKKFDAELIETKLMCEKVILLKPQTFMNDSGAAVRVALQYYKLVPQDLLVIHDDLDLKLGTLRLAFGAGSAGHRGVQSIIDTLHTKEFWRLRVGIGLKRGAAESFVLKPFSRLEQAKLKKTLALVAHAVQMIFELGHDRTQTEINKT
ncbi:MAG: Peptidyl-tRNA hydrolase [Candidatus Magasanikbacteria bacterium GW2011_GWA2_50_22]|uniref:Peptidyl-tRNA hydrolase n=1 Tax=Candidatus Magasanikbacteria bacterium GW2011_GWA2_50_22 TaxID=1619043 RepID=A0A0G1WF31_9BACT|nr:MAG: Peptidyl-tRNA hydrolase [Candidatus Magasanikbacteria bacterium GW2011_GWA2_50_22]